MIDFFYFILVHLIAVVQCLLIHLVHDAKMQSVREPR